MRLRVLVALLVLYTVWGSTYLAIHWIVLAKWPLLLTAAIRFALASAGFHLLGRLLDGHRPATLRQIGNAAVAGAFLFVASNGLVMWAQTRVASGLAALLVALTPVWITVFEALLGAPPAGRRLVGVLVGILGVAVLVDPRSGAVDAWGAAGLLGASVCWSIGTVWSKRVDLPASVWASAGWQTAFAAAALAVASAARGDRLPAALDPAPSLAFLWLLLGGSLAGFGAFGWLLRNTTPALTTTYAYVNPLVAAILGWAFADEPFTLRTGLASALILGGVAAITSSPTTPPARVIAPEPAVEPRRAA